MFQIDSATAAGSLPVVPASGTPGFFSQGVPGTSTIVPDWWLNQVQAELLAIAGAAAVTPVKTTWTQVRQAICRLCAGNVTALTTNATLTADNLGLVTVNASSGSFVVTLPPAVCLAAAVPARLRLVRTGDAPANSVTVQLAGSDAFAGGAATNIGLAAGDAVDLVGDGAGSWWVTRTGPSVWIVQGAGSGSFIQPVGYSGIEIEMIGPAGGGGGSTSSWAAGGGGAGGAVRHTARSVPHGTIWSFGVGFGGAGGAAGANGAAGSGATTLAGSGLSLTAGTGAGGISGATTGGPSAGGGGGPALGGAETFGGGDGGDGSETSSLFGGNGAPGLYGGGGRAAASIAGVAGTAPGAGGGGGYSGNVPGGRGADGALRYRFLP